MRAFAIIAAGLAAFASPATALTFGNAPYPAQQVISPFGTLPGSSPTYAQVFVSPASGTLTSFSFTLTGEVGQIFAGLDLWNGSYVYTSGGGSAANLYQSSYVPTGPGQTTYTFTPNVPILNLTLYVAYISVYGSPDANGSTDLVLGDNSNPALRYFTFDNGSGSPSGNPAWTNYDLDIGDALFSATVTNPVFPPAPPGVPEPAEWALLIGGFAFAGLAARRRRFSAA